jgi:hypothetical protein
MVLIDSIVNSVSPFLSSSYSVVEHVITSRIQALCNKFNWYSTHRHAHVYM